MSGKEVFATDISTGTGSVRMEKRWERAGEKGEDGGKQASVTVILFFLLPAVVYRGPDEEM